MGPALNHFIFHAGQPEWVQHAHAEATGVAIQPISVIDL
jgi:5,5'-dehydrodivanillate O-demethylase oxygenase subunit